MDTQVVVNCSTGAAATVALTPAQQALRDADVQVFLSLLQTDLGRMAFANRHRAALASVRDTLAASEQATSADLAGLVGAVNAAQAGTPLTPAQLLGLLRFLLRALAATVG